MKPSRAAVRIALTLAKYNEAHDVISAFNAGESWAKEHVSARATLIDKEIAPLVAQCHPVLKQAKRFVALQNGAGLPTGIYMEEQIKLRTAIYDFTPEPT